MTFEQWLETNEWYPKALKQWMDIAVREAWQAGYNQKTKEVAPLLLEQLTQESQQLGLYDDNAINPMIKD